MRVILVIFLISGFLKPHMAMKQILHNISSYYFFAWKIIIDAFESILLMHSDPF